MEVSKRRFSQDSFEAGSTTSGGPGVMQCMSRSPSDTKFNCLQTANYVRENPISLLTESSTNGLCTCPYLATSGFLLVRRLYNLDPPIFFLDVID